MSLLNVNTAFTRPLASRAITLPEASPSSHTPSAIKVVTRTLEQIFSVQPTP